MRITWSLPVRGERLDSSRGDLVRARRLIEALRAEGHELQVVEDAARSGSALAVGTYRRVIRRLLSRRTALVLRDLGRWRHARGHGRRVAAAARTHEADIIVETQVHLAASGALAARLSGRLLVLDDCSPAGEEVLLGAGLPPLVRHLFRQQVRAAARLVVSSQALAARMVEEGVPAPKLQVVPNGVDVRAFRLGGRPELFAGAGADCVLGFVGSFQPWHGVELLFEALARLPDLRLHVVLVGDGPGRRQALAAARRLALADRVTDMGKVDPDRVPQVVAGFHVGVLPGSNDYGHPMKLLEYAAAGLPSVAPDLPPVREVVEHEVTGLLFRPDDADALAEALRRLARDEPLRRRLGGAARGRVTAEASWRARARALIAGLARGDGGANP
jgi:glycosyltransferase involved in cell wall biosynthesis